MSCPRPNTPRSNPKDVGELAEPLRSRIWTAMLDAPRGALIPVSLYRDPGRQWDLRHDRCPGRECNRSCKGYPVTAVPAQFINGEWVGGSRHQHRQAADMGGRDLDWLIINRAKYGLGLTVKPENWHFEASGVDARTGRSIKAPTVRIIQYGKTGEPKPNPLPEDFLMPVTEQQWNDLANRVERIESAIAGVERKDFAMRDKREPYKVWVFTSGGRYWIRNKEALALMVYAGKIAGFGPDGIPWAENAYVDGIPEIATPTDVWDQQVAFDPSIANG